VRTILVVEDEWAIADWLNALLGDEGYRVLVAHNGVRALDVLKDNQADIVLTDFMMPVMDGAALVEAIRRDEATRDIPVIVMSSLPEQAIAERFPDHAAFVRKPFREDELLRAITKILDSK
jgi:two-component system chemotaxis sensor kinase CheA